MTAGVGSLTTRRARRGRRIGRLLLALSLLTASLLAGCTRADQVNPNLLAPKLVVDLGLHGTPIVYVHSAFGERAYDRIEILLDNETFREAEYAYSLEDRLESPVGFLEVRVRSGESRFVFRGHVVFDGEEERVRVTTVDDEGRWSDPRSFNLPFERILDREGGPAS